MKKLLSILLATATVFSTTAFANPAAEPIESADEISIEVEGAISSKISDASLAEETASYYDPALGVKIIDEDFESFTVGEIYGSAEVPHGNLKYSTVGAGTTAELVEGVEGVEKGKCVKIDIGNEANWPSFRILLAKQDEYVNLPATFTMSSKLYVVGDDFADGISAKPQMLLSPWEINAASPTKLEKDIWQDLVKTVTSSSEGKKARGLYWSFDNSSKAGTIYIDDIKLYYKPIATDNYNVIKPTYPTVTVNAPGGIEENAAMALMADPQEYFGSHVTSCNIEGETIHLP